MLNGIMEPSQQAYRNFQRHVDRLCLLIVASDCSDREIDIERLHLRVQAATLFPGKMPLYDMVYEDLLQIGARSTPRAALTLPFERLGPGLTNGSWTTFGPIPCSPSIDKTLKIEPWARRDVLSTLCPLNVRSCVAGACTYLQQIPISEPGRLLERKRSLLC
jgi:hypothetical protein